MNVVIVTQWFPPEQAPVGYMLKELAQALISKGHSVTVITGFPNHPGGEVFGGYKKQWVLKEEYGGIEVIRTWLFTSKNRTIINRILNFLSFTLTSSLALLRTSKPDVVFGVMQPLSFAVTMPILTRLKRAKLILNIQDLHPDVPIELGMIKNKLLIALLRKMEQFGYTKSSGLAVICESFKQHCISKGATQSAIEVIPNWLDLDEIKPMERNNAFRAELGLQERDFVLLFAGTVGWVSGAEVIIDAAKQLTEIESIKILFVGEGPLIPQLKSRVANEKLNNVVFAPFQPREKLVNVQAVSDISLVSLSHGKGKNSVPSKVLGYMAASRPVIASVDEDSETAIMVRDAEAGWITKSECPGSLANLIKHLYSAPSALAEKGRNGRQYLETHFRKDTITDKYISFFEKVHNR